MGIFKKTKPKVKETTHERNLRQGLYSSTAVEHSYMKSGVRDGGLGNAQKLAVLQMLRDEEK